MFVNYLRPRTYYDRSKPPKINNSRSMMLQHMLQHMGKVKDTEHECVTQNRRNTDSRIMLRVYYTRGAGGGWAGGGGYHLPPSSELLQSEKPQQHERTATDNECYASLSSAMLSQIITTRQHIQTNRIATNTPRRRTCPLVWLGEEVRLPRVSATNKV